MRPFLANVTQLAALTWIVSSPALAQMRPPAPEVTFPEGATVVEVPFELEGHLIALPVRVGDTSLRMILDTGASGAVLHESEWIERLGLAVLGEARVGGAGTGEMSTATVAGPIRMDLEGLTIDRSMIVAGVGEGLGGRTWDGAMGAGLLEKTIAEVDYEAGLLRLHDPESFEMPDAAVVIPAKRLSNNLSAVEAEITIDGETTRRWLVVDLGAFHALSLNAEDGSLPARRLDGKETLGYGTQGPIPGYVGVIDRFKLGEIELTDVVTTFPGAEGLRSARQLSERDVPVSGNLGSAILRHYTVIVDFPGERLGLRPRATPAPPFNFTTTGLLSRPGASPDGYQIERVLPKTPAAEAGLERGDVILTLNGERVASQGLGLRSRLMDPPPGTELAITYRRDGEEKAATLIARPLFGDS